MGSSESVNLQDWVGRVEEAEDRLSLFVVRALATTLGLGPDDWERMGLIEGGPVPPLWHWLGFLPLVEHGRIDRDGHPLRGGFLPPVALERRMWAGGRLQWEDGLRIGEVLHRRSEIVKVAEKEGSTGRMAFVTVGHTISTPRGVAIREEQDIVYVAMPETYRPPPPVAPPPDPDWVEEVAIDTVRLFRFSAATFNAHRIHFDLPYAQNVEKYPGLVVQGPMQAIFLMEAARQRHGADPARYQFRGVRPLFHFNTLRLMVGTLEDDATRPLCTVTEEDCVCMQARASW